MRPRTTRRDAGDLGPHLCALASAVRARRPPPRWLRRCGRRSPGSRSTGERTRRRPYQRVPGTRVSCQRRPAAALGQIPSGGFLGDRSFRPRGRRHGRQQRHRARPKVAQRFGTRAAVRWTRGVLIGFWFELGNWDTCAPAADEFLAESAAAGPRPASSAKQRHCGPPRRNELGCGVLRQPDPLAAERPGAGLPQGATRWSSVPARVPGAFRSGARRPGAGRQHR